jgi:hypothetical protein
MATTEEMIAKTALNVMMKKSYFDICTLEKVAAVLNVHPDAKTSVMLRTLHCVEYGDMSTELRHVIPHLISQYLNHPAFFQFSWDEETINHSTTVSDDDVPVSGLKRLMTYLR